MPRPKVCRRVACQPLAVHFKPQGIPLRELEVVTLALDELEALRLVDFEALPHEAAAERMGVSRATVGRIVEAARRHVADALLHGKALQIEGGVIEMSEEMRQFMCLACGHTWGEPWGTGRPAECPSCHSREIRRADCGRGPGQGRGRGWCHGPRRGSKTTRARAASPATPNISEEE